MTVTANPDLAEKIRTEARKVVRERDRYNASSWHTDVTFVERPALQDFLRGLTGIHSGEHAFAHIRQQRDEGVEWEGGAQYLELTPVEHPVVRTHPETGKEGLFVNRQRVTLRGDVPR